MKRVSVEVSEVEIKEAEGRKGGWKSHDQICPTALAINRRLKLGYTASVIEEGLTEENHRVLLQVQDSKTGIYGKEIPLPKKCAKVARTFDKDGKIKPFKFSFLIPDGQKF